MLCSVLSWASVLTPSLHPATRERPGINGVCRTVSAWGGVWPRRSCRLALANRCSVHMHRVRVQCWHVPNRPKSWRQWGGRATLSRRFSSCHGCNRHMEIKKEKKDVTEVDRLWLAGSIIDNQVVQNCSMKKGLQALNCIFSPVHQWRVKGHKQNKKKKKLSFKMMHFEVIWRT